MCAVWCEVRQGLLYLYRISLNSLQGPNRTHPSQIPRAHVPHLDLSTPAVAPPQHSLTRATRHDGKRLLAYRGMPWLPRPHICLTAPCGGRARIRRARPILSLILDVITTSPLTPRTRTAGRARGVSPTDTTPPLRPPHAHTQHHISVLFLSGSDAALSCLESALVCRLDGDICSALDPFCSTRRLVICT